MRRIYSLVIGTILFSACETKSEQDKQAPKDSAPVVITNDTIPEIRTNVRKAAIASYSEPVPDELNNWKFAVNIYETPKTFRFLLKLQYKELRAEDTLKIPNFGIVPSVEIIKGKQPYECIIGFKDKKAEFKPYKMVSVKGDQLKITTLAGYSTGVYRVTK